MSNCFSWIFACHRFGTDSWSYGSLAQHIIMYTMSGIRCFCFITCTYAIDVYEVAKYFTEELHHQLVREREKLDVAQLVSYISTVHRLRYQIPVFRKLISNSKNLSKQCKFKISMPHTKGRHRHRHFLRSLHIWTGNLHSLKTLSKSRYFIKQIVLSLQNQIQFIWAL